MSTPVEIEFIAKDSLTPTVDKVGRKTKTMGQSAKEAEAGYAALQNRMVELRGNIALLESKLEDLRLAGEVASPDLDQTENIANINALERQIEDLKTKLKELQVVAEQVEVTPPGMEPAQRKFNGLHNSIQQMAREMPSLAMGPQMFFMAISNNLPIFADELSRARKEYNELIKTGQKGVPVWKQIVSSLFSWQTALTTAIMLLIMYADEIGNWVNSLVGANKAVNELGLSYKEMVEIERSGRAEMIRTTAEINTAINSIKNFTGSIDDEKKKITELNDKYGETFGYYNSLAEWYDVLIEKGTDYVQTLYLQAKAQALVDKAVDADSKIEDKKATIAEGPGFWDYALTLPFFASWDRYGGWGNYTKGHIYSTETHDIKELERDKAAWLKEAENIYAQIEEIKKNSNLGGFDRPDDPARVKSQKEINSLLLELQRQNQQDDIALQSEGTEKKLAQIRFDYNARKEEIARLEAEFRSFNKNKGLGDKLTPEQKSALDKARELAEQSRIEAGADVMRESQKEEKVAMIEYLKQYGSFQQQKLAIAEEYAALIADVDASAVSESTKQWQKAKLLKEQKQREASLSFENISRGIDWNALFSGIGNLTQEMLAPMMEQLQAYVKTDEYAAADAQTQQEVTALIQELRQYVGTDQSTTWETLDQAIKDFTQSVAAYDNAKKAEDSAVAAREAGRQKLASGEISAEEFRHLEEEADRLGNATATARDSMEFFADRLNIVSDEVANFTSGLTTALNNAKGWKGLEGFSEVQSAVGNIDSLKGTLDSILPSLGDGMASKIGGSLSSALGSGLSSLGSGLSNIMSSGIGGMVGIVAQIPKLILDLVGAVKNMVVGILNSLTELISLRWIDDLVVSILDAVGELVNAIFDLPENLYKVLEAIIVDGIGGLLDTVIGRIGNVLSFGYLSSDGPSAWFTNSNEKDVANTIERLTARNETLQTAIEDLTSEIVQSRGTISVNAYKKAVEYQKENNQNYLAMAQAQAGYHSSHHSWNYYWGGFSDADIQDFSNQIGRSWDGNIWNLSPEEMKLLRGNVDMWAKIQNTGEGGYGSRLTEKLDDYIEQAGKLEELTDTLYEGLTGISFDGVYDSFVDSLMNMKYSAKDAAEDISEYFMRAMLSNRIGEMYADKLEEWWQDFGRAMEDGDLDAKEREELLNRYLGYVEDAQKLRDDIASATGYTGEGGTSQSGKSGAFSQSITYDQGTKLEGLFTSGQMHWASIDEHSENISEKMSIAEGHLARIEENTGTCVKELKEIKEEVKKQNRDGLKMK